MWHLYILKCSDDSFYTGITKDIPHRLEMHNAGKGAKYTRSHRPVELVYFEENIPMPEVMKREREIKRYGRARKEKLVSNFPEEEIEKILRPAE